MSDLQSVAMRSGRSALLALGMAIGATLVPGCASTASAQVSGSRPAPADSEAANADLKTCLQRRYAPEKDNMAQYRSGDRLVAACKVEWDAAEAACAKLPGNSRDHCDAQTKMFLLGFVPMY